jgi:hypothetical protein
MPKTRGRTTKLTPALQTAIVEAVSKGVPYCQAALLADIGITTAKEWRARGEGRDATRPQTPQFAAFAAVLQKAEAANEARQIQVILDAAAGGMVIEESTTVFPDGKERSTRKYTAPQWQASAWYLERRYPDRYALRNRLDITLKIEALAAQMADKLGVDAQELIREAQVLLEESTYGRDGA